MTSEDVARFFHVDSRLDKVSVEYSIEKEVAVYVHVLPLSDTDCCW